MTKLSFLEDPSFCLLDEKGIVVDELKPGDHYGEEWLWDVLRIRTKGSAGITLRIQSQGFETEIDEHWTLALKSLGQSGDAVRLIRMVVEKQLQFEEAEAAILKNIFNEGND